MANDRLRAYLQMLRGDYVKLAKLEFLNPGGTVAFTLDNNAKNRRSGAFLQEGNLSCRLQNGRRREMDVVLANLDREYSFAVNKIWFGQQIRYSEGLILPGGSEFYLPQGIFEIESPTEARSTNRDTVQYHLVDKWANLDGTLHGTLDGDYKVLAGTNIFTAMAAVLRLGIYDLGSNSQDPIDSVAPIFTTYYNGKTQTLTDGSTVALTDAPYDMLIEGGRTAADIQLGLAEMLAAWIGYDAAGRLVVDPSQDDILDTTKPVQWEFTPRDKGLISITKAPKVSEVYNDIIVVGATSDDYSTARGRAQNVNPASSTCISRIGLKSRRIPMPNYYSDQICEDYAAWTLKRTAALNQAVSLNCNQMFHIRENELIRVVGEDGKAETYLVQGFSRPVSQTGTMTIEAVAVNELEVATVA